MSIQKKTKYEDSVLYNFSDDLDVEFYDNLSDKVRRFNSKKSNVFKKNSWKVTHRKCFFLKPKNVSGAVTVKRDTGPFSKWKIDGASE